MASTSIAPRGFRSRPPHSPTSAAIISTITEHRSLFRGQDAAVLRAACGGEPAVIWTDDPKSGDVSRCRKRGHQLSRRPQVETSASRLSGDSAGSSADLEMTADLSSSLPLIGAYQAANALVAAGLAMATGGDRRDSPPCSGLRRSADGWSAPRSARAVRPVYVDYAHTPDALEAAIDALRPHEDGPADHALRCRGDRDQGKRPEWARRGGSPTSSS